MTPSHNQQELRALTSLEAAGALLMERLAPVAPVSLALGEALGCICAEPVTASLHPPQAIALRDGWALHSHEIIGASNYAPVMPASPPLAIEAGEALAPGYDCVVEPYGVEIVGPMAQVMVEPAPGANVRRPGEDASAGQALLAQGQSLRPGDLACAALLGLTHVSVRQPHVAIVDAPARDGACVTRDFLARALASDGARVSLTKSADRSAQAIAAAFKGLRADLILILGGTGSGASDHGVAALRLCGGVHLHGLALEPGRSAAIASVNDTDVIALPGLFDQAFGVWLGLVRPALDRLTLRQPRAPLRLALTEKISSRVGVAEVALLRREGDAFRPLAVGDLPLQCLSAATHAAIIGAGAEGHPAGEAVEAFALAGAD